LNPNGGEGPSSQEPPSQTLTLPFGEISSDSEDEIEEIPRPFTPHEPPEETALAARLRQVAQDLESLDNPLPHTHTPGPRLQGIQRRNEEWARANPLDRDDRIRVDLMYKLGFTDSEIVKEFKEKKWTIRQVQHARAQPHTPRSRRNFRGPVLRTEHRKKLVRWIQESPSHRLVKWEDIPGHLDLGIPYGVKAIKAAMDTEGYGRRVSRIRPPISDKVRHDRLAFAWAHITWTWINWFRYLWSDETWVTGGSHGRVWVTRLIGQNEEWHRDTITQRHRKKPGWMAWGCFAGTLKGPLVIWEKEWGTINAVRTPDFDLRLY
jgi:hypothetical protein